MHVTVAVMFEGLVGLKARYCKTSGLLIEHNLG